MDDLICQYCGKNYKRKYALRDHFYVCPKKIAHDTKLLTSDELLDRIAEFISWSEMNGHDCTLYSIYADELRTRLSP